MDDLDTLKAARAAAIAADGAYSKTRLKTEFGLRPRAGVRPVRYCDGRYGQYGVYRVADCEVIADLSKPTADERRAQRVSTLESWLFGDHAGLKAQQLLDAGALVLDTETTGLGNNAQIIELGIVDSAGTVVFESRLRPSVRISSDATDVHGISEADLAGAPDWADVADQVESLLIGKPVLIFNANYDCRLLRQTAEAFSCSTGWIREMEVECAMYLAADAYGATNRYGSISLSTAMWKAGASWRSRAHSAVADALATLDVVQAIAERRREREAELTRLATQR